MSFARASQRVHIENFVSLSKILGSCDKPELMTNRVFEQNTELKKITLSIGGEATLKQGKFEKKSRKCSLFSRNEHQDQVPREEVQQEENLLDQKWATD